MAPLIKSKAQVQQTIMQAQGREWAGVGFMIAPRFPGEQIRQTYLMDGGVPAYVDIVQDYSGNGNSILKNLTDSLGFSKGGVINLSFKQEAEIDLFIEQFMAPTFFASAETAYELLIKKGYPKEAVCLELYFSGELGAVRSMMGRDGLYEGFQKNASPTCQYGVSSSRASLWGEDMKQKAEMQLERITSGKFSEELSDHKYASKVVNEFVESDIATVLSECEIPKYGSDRDVLHAQPVNFTLDHKNGLVDPRGQIGKKLSVDMHLLTVDSSSIEAILHCVKRCDLELAGLASSAYVSAISSMVEDEQEIGAACIEMGGGTTGVSIFLKKHMIYSDLVRIGGDHITSDISHGLQIPIELAERIKNVNGGVLATGMDDRETIEIGGNTGDWEHDKRLVTRSESVSYTHLTLPTKRIV